MSLYCQLIKNFYEDDTTYDLTTTLLHILHYNVLSWDDHHKRIPTNRLYDAY